GVRAGRGVAGGQGGGVEGETVVEAGGGVHRGRVERVVEGDVDAGTRVDGPVVVQGGRGGHVDHLHGQGRRGGPGEKSILPGTQVVAGLAKLPATQGVAAA